MLADILHKVGADDMAERKEYKYYPRPSSAGQEKCIRQLVYFGLDTPKKSLAGRAVFIFDDSTWHEELTANWIRQSAFSLHSEQMKVDCGSMFNIHLRGSIDGIVTDLLGKDYLWEHKALNHFTFQRFWGGELPMDYFAQCGLYLRGLQAWNPDLKKGVLLIKNKNTSAYIEFIIQYDMKDDCFHVINKINSIGESVDIGLSLDSFTKNIFWKFAQVQMYIDKKRYPKRQYHWTDWQCEYCPYTETCWASYKEDFQDMNDSFELPVDIVDLVKEYKQLSSEKGEIEKQHKGIGEKIKSGMRNNNARRGFSNDIVCELKMQARNGIDKKLLTKTEIEKATRQTTFERLYIKKRKDKK
jgi:hypothetical protein